MIDKVDELTVSRYRWNLDAGGYARSGTRRVSILMHRLITAATPGFEVDHKDRDRLNNCRGNLRTCTRLQNAMNRIGKGEGRGVYRRHNGRWTARIQHDGTERTIGTYDTKEEAIEARREAEIEIRGSFAPEVKP